MVFKRPETFHYRKQLSKEIKEEGEEEVESKKSLWGPTRNVSVAAMKFKMIGEKAREKERKALQRIESNEFHPSYDLDGCFMGGEEHVSDFPGLPSLILPTSGTDSGASTPPRAIFRPVTPRENSTRRRRQATFAKFTPEPYNKDESDDEI